MVGAGSIAPVHARILGLMKSVDLVAVVDPQLERASKLANLFQIPAVYEDIDRLLDQQAIDAAHVLVPPELHASVAEKLVSRGVNVLIEKPMAASSAECRELIGILGQPGRGSIYVNHNFLFHPTFAALYEMVENREFGPPIAISCTYAMPLRQLDTGEFYHWMFRRPENLLLEQAIHPLSQLVKLAGPVETIHVLPGASLAVDSGLTIPTCLSVLLHCRHHDAHLQLQFGATFPRWYFSVLCADAVIEADIVRNTLVAQYRSQWLEPIDNVLQGRRLGRALWKQDVGNLTDYALSLLKIGNNTSPYLSSMSASIRTFHSMPRGEIPLVNRADGAGALVRLCEDIAAIYPTRRAEMSRPLSRNGAQPCEVVVLGGSGFIGRHVVKAFVNQGVAVRVFARHTQRGGVPLENPLVSFFGGSLSRFDDVAAAIEGVKCVVNATGGQLGETWKECEESVRGSISNLCEACLQSGTRRVVHLSSSAALYLGRPEIRIAGSDPIDPHLNGRAFYAHAKGLADELLLAAHAGRGLPVCILRPAIVLGEGGTPFHSGVGLFLNGRHFLGWNKGNNPLPFVLASDVAAAVVAACLTPNIEGRSYNLAGDVRFTAREYVRELAKVFERPFLYHPQSAEWLWATEVGKWAIKAASGRKAWRPSYRDLRSRAFLSWIESEDAKRDLGWKPISDPSAFLREAMAVHKPNPQTVA
jgi:nucleoside-diphosphate-sugar epimerase/predicted dehydrogenase